MGSKIAPMADSTSLEYFPAQIFRDKLANCEIQSTSVIQGASTTATNVAAVAGKIIRVIAIHAFNDAAGPGYCTLLSAASAKLRFYVPGTTSGYYNTFEFNPAGWVDTVVGERLDLTTPAGASFYVTLRYITFTP